MKSAENRGDKVELILYRSEYQQGFFTYDDANTVSTNEAMQYY